jgi:hypothetical protein
MRIRDLCVLAAATSILAIASQAMAQSPEPCVEFPPQIALLDGLDVYARVALARSPTLARQCAELSAAPGLRVIVRLARSRLHGCRARAMIARSPRGVSAVIEIPAPISSDFGELLAHEFEHVLEQVEGQDLAGMVNRGTRAVYRTASGAFETERAKQAGEAARRELSADATGLPVLVVWRAVAGVLALD